jgi:hypothetical protein
MLTIDKSSFAIFSYSSFWVPLIAILARLNPSTAEISFFIIAGYALLGKQQSIQALALLFLFTMINPGIAPHIEIGPLLRYVVLFSVFLSIFLRISFLKYHSIAFYTLVFAVFILIHSFFFSKFAIVSILKIVSWTIVIISLLKAWGELNELEHVRMKKWISRFFLFILLSSLPFLLIPEIGYRYNLSGFQGVLNHPQAFGVFIALVAAIFFAHFFEKNKFSWSLVSLLFLICLLIFLSKARTAILSLFMSLSITLFFFFITFFLKKKFVLPIFQTKRFFFILFLVFFLLFTSKIIKPIDSFLQKNTSNINNLFEIFKESRGVLFQPMIENINKNFITGIGFGIASDPLSMNIQRDPFLNLPISVSVEKGTIYIAILEELGIFGFILFVIWVFILFYKVVIYSYASMIILITILLLNIGEAMLFSIGGMGLPILILLTSIISRPKLSLNSSTSTY